MKKSSTILVACMLMITAMQIPGAFAQAVCQASFTALADSTGNGVHFTNTSTGTNPNTTYLWHFGDSTTSTFQNPYHTYAQANTYNVCLTISVNLGNGTFCTNTFCHNVTAGQPSTCAIPTGLFANNLTTTSATLHWNSTGATSYNIRYRQTGTTAWTAKSSSTNSKTLTGLSPATSYQWKVRSKCVSAAGTITNSAWSAVSNFTSLSPSACNASFTWTTGSAPHTVIFTNTSTGTNANTTYSWDFGDNTTSNLHNPSHTYSQSGNHNVCLTISVNLGNGTFCTNTYCHNVTSQLIAVSQTALARNSSNDNSAAVTYADMVMACNALFGFHQTTNTLTVNFTDSSTSSHTITTWLWSFGDGTTSTLQNPSHTYAHDGTYYVCLTIHDNHGCSNQICHHITVSAVVSPCHAAFTFHADSTGNVILFTNTSTGTTIHTTYSWTFGDGNTSTNENPHHTYALHGHYTVCLFISDSTTGCSSHICRSLNYHHYGHHHHYVLATQDRTQSESDESMNNENYIINYPNPFHSSTTIQYELTEDANVSIEIYDLLGNRIIRVVNEKQSQGQHTQLVNADNLNLGIYFIKMIAGDELYMQKISVVK